MTALGSNPETAQRERGQDEDDAPPKKRERRKILTSERAIAAVASALAAYLVTRNEMARSEMALKAPPSNDLVAPLVSSVEKLKTDVLRIEGKVDAIQDKVAGIKDAVTLLQVSAANNEFRLQRVEAETASLKARRQ